MTFQGYLQKMKSAFEPSLRSALSLDNNERARDDDKTQQTVQYYLNLSSELIHMNALIGKELQLIFQHKITCFCGKEVDRVFRQNFCFDCFQTKPEAGEAIFFPEKSKAHLGIEDRDLEYERQYQLQDHVVYLANSGGLKVGVTRKSARFQRWIDQGAHAAIVLAETSNRYEAGIMESYLKGHLADKTDWRNMLSKGDPDIDLVSEKQRIADLLSDDLKGFLSANDEITTMNYPVTDYPDKVKSQTFKKTDEISGELGGIRGQYLIFSDGSVFNVRSHEGHHVQIHVRF
jgi:hypothetical protein